MALIHKNVLLVEGVQEVRVIPELIEANGIDCEQRKILLSTFAIMLVTQI